jgi:hypothetical protein
VAGLVKNSIFHSEPFLKIRIPSKNLKEEFRVFSQGCHYT